MKEIKEIESLLNAAKAAFTNPNITKSLRDKTRKDVKQILILSRWLLCNKTTK